MSIAPYNRKSSLLKIPVDWESQREKLSIKSDGLKQAGLKVRYQTEHETWNIHSKLQSAAHRSNVGLLYRIQDLQKVKEVLLEYLDAIRIERSHLTDALDAIVHALDDISPLADIVTEIITLRQGKDVEESLEDDAHRDLRVTICSLANVEDRLHRLRLEVEPCVHQTTLEIEGRLASAVNDQQSSLEIDRSQLALTELSPELGPTKLDPLRSIQQGQRTINAIWWEEHLAALKTDAQEVLGRSRSMREAANFEFTRSKNEQQARKDAIQYSLRKCIHRLEQAVQNLMSQKDIMTNELMNLNASIGQANNYRRNMMNPLRLAQTRLENRRERPEPCFDFSQRSLEFQVEILGLAGDTMDQRLGHSRGTRIQLEEHLDEVIRELKRKNGALEIDRKCLNMMDRFDATVTFSEISIKPHYPENFPVPVIKQSY